MLSSVSYCFTIILMIYLPELMKTFELFDINGDCHISAEELGNVLQTIGQNPTEGMIKGVMTKAGNGGRLKCLYAFIVRYWCHHMILKLHF